MSGWHDLNGFTLAHPFMPDELIQGALKFRKPGRMPCRDQRHGCRQPAAGSRGARRTDGHPDDSRVSRVKGQATKENPHSGFRARHQPCQRSDLRVLGRKHSFEQPGRSIWTPEEGRRRRCRGDHDHQSEHPRRVRNRDRRNRQSFARSRSPCLHGRRELERHDGNHTSG